jgi:hypothetical protein
LCRGSEAMAQVLEIFKKMVFAPNTQRGIKIRYLTNITNITNIKTISHFAVNEDRQK